MQAGGKDSHVWFVNYTSSQVEERLSQWWKLAARADSIARHVPSGLADAYFELIQYPICGAAMLNEYQLVARRSMVRADRRDFAGAAYDGVRVREMFEALNEWTRRYNEDVCNGKWKEFFNWRPYHQYWSETLDVPYFTSETDVPSAASRFISVDEALSSDGVSIFCEADSEIPLWVEAVSPVRNFSKAPEDNVFCRVTMGSDDFDASATPINNVWHSPIIGPMWSKVGTLHLKKGENLLKVSGLRSGARIDRIYMGIWPPFEDEPRLRIAASGFVSQNDDSVICVKGLGYSDGVMVRRFDTPSYEVSEAGALPNGNFLNEVYAAEEQYSVSEAPYVEYDIEFCKSDTELEVRTLPTLHVHEGRDARYAVQIGSEEPHVFSIHADDFTAEWRLNVLRGYSTRSVSLPSGMSGKQKIRVYFLDPGIVLQEILVR